MVSFQKFILYIKDQFFDFLLIVSLKNILKETIKFLIYKWYAFTTKIVTLNLKI